MSDLPVGYLGAGIYFALYCPQYDSFQKHKDRELFSANSLEVSESFSTQIGHL